jgi:hypothetical protein
MGQQLDEMKPKTETESSHESSLVAAAGGNEQKQQALQVVEDARDANYVYPSFGAQLFEGKFDISMLHPYPIQDPADKKIGDEFIAKLSKFLEENLDPEEVDRTHEIPKNVMDGLAKMGVFALKVPKEYGGLGFSQTNYNRVVMVVASYCGATAVLISAHQSIGVPQPLKYYGTEAQKKKFMPRFREGTISAFALTELDVGSDPAQMSCEAKLSEDGTYYTLNGTKLWCTNGTIAEVIVVTAKTAPKIVKGKEKKQISAFILEMNTPGVEVVHRCEFMGLKGIYNGLLKFTNVKIPAENLLWAEGRGLAMALATINVGRLTLPAACAGGAKQCLSIARRWGTERVQWGMPIGLHEAGREKIAYIASTTFAMEAIAWLTSSWQDQGKVDIRIEAAMAKMFCTEEVWKIIDTTLQLRGGRGYETARSLKARGEPAYPVERMLRDSRINRILEGSTEIMQLFLAREAMDSHLKRAENLLNPRASLGAKIGTFFKSMGHYAVWYPKMWFKSFFSSSYSDFGELAKYNKFIEKRAPDLARNIFFYMARYQAGLERKQMILARLMNIATDLFAMAATCAYAASLHQKQGKDRDVYELADYFCAMAMRRIDSQFEALTDNEDKKANKLAKDVIDKKFAWFEKDNVIWCGPDT